MKLATTIAIAFGVAALGMPVGKPAKECLGLGDGAGEGEVVGEKGGMESVRAGKAEGEGKWRRGDEAAAMDKEAARAVCRRLKEKNREKCLHAVEVAREGDVIAYPGHGKRGEDGDEGEW